MRGNVSQKMFPSLPTVEHMAKHRQETMFPQQRSLVCTGLYSKSISTSDKLKNMPDHGGNRTRDLWNASQMLRQRSYAVRVVRVCDISKPNLIDLMLNDVILWSRD